MVEQENVISRGVSLPPVPGCNESGCTLIGHRLFRHHLFRENRLVDAIVRSGRAVTLLHHLSLGMASITIYHGTSRCLP